MAQFRCMKAGSVRNVAVSFSSLLDTGEALTGTPTVTATGLTISGEIVNIDVIDIEGVSVPIGEAVQFTVSGGVDATQYTISIVVSSDAGQTFLENVYLQVD